jgi:hypothetical protein
MNRKQDKSTEKSDWNDELSALLSSITHRHPGADFAACTAEKFKAMQAINKRRKIIVLFFVVFLLCTITSWLVLINTIFLAKHFALGFGLMSKVINNILSVWYYYPVTGLKMLLVPSVFVFLCWLLLHNLHSDKMKKIL